MRKSSQTVLNIMIIITILFGIITFLLFYLFQKFNIELLNILAITFLTTFYHLSMRLLVGEVITIVFKNKVFNDQKLGFKIYKFEDKLYKILKVKKWKGNVLTAKKEQFDLSIVSLNELLHNIMQAELVHRIIMVLSFIPLLFIIPFGKPVVFIVTSIISSLIDYIFVIIQRYNRPRLNKIIKLKK